MLRLLTILGVPLAVLVWPGFAPAGDTPPAGSIARSTTSGSANALMMVNGDRVQVKDGTVTVNGVSYGTVAPTDRVEYVSEDGHGRLLINGEPRGPAEPAK